MVGLLFLLLLSDSFQRVFSGEHCLHRDEQRFRQNPLIHNTELKNALLRYNEIHKQCYQYIEEEVLAPINDKNTLNEMKCKYIILNVDISGLGNRLMTVLTYFLMALLTDRVLLILSEEYNWNEIFCEPFHNSSWIFPTSKITPETYHKIIKESSNFKSIYNPIDRYQHANLTDTRHHIGLAHIWNIHHGEQYWLPLLFNNPYYTDILYRWFPDRRPAHVLTNYLLHPQNDVWLDILDSWSIHYTENRLPIFALQSRWWRSERSGNISIVDCLQLYDNNIMNISYAHVYMMSLYNYKDKVIHEGWVVHQKYSGQGVYIFICIYIYSILYIYCILYMYCILYVYCILCVFMCIVHRIYVYSYLHVLYSIHICV